MSLVLATLVTWAPAWCAQSAPRKPCWRRPGPECRTIIISEVGYERMFITNTRHAIDHTGTVSDESRAFGEQLSWELGALMRVQPGRAIGPAFAFGFAETGGRTALKIRARQFVNERTSFELSAGYLSASVGTFVTHPRQPGFTVDARVNVEDLISVLVTYDDVSWPDSTAGVFHYTDDASRGRALKAGISAGSWAGVGATAVIAILFGLFAVAYAQGT